MDNSITIIVSENPQEYRWKATTMLDGIRDLLGWIQRYIFRRDVKLEPLYKLDLTAHDEKVASREGGGQVISPNTEM